MDCRNQIHTQPGVSCLGSTHMPHTWGLTCVSCFGSVVWASRVRESLPTGGTPSVFLRASMRSLDLFSWKKIIAPDFFENTLPGAWLSISAAVVMGVLFVADLTSYLSVKVTSEVVMTSYVATGRSPPPPSPRSPSLDRRWPALLAPAACMSTWPRPVGVCMRLGDPP